MPSDWNNELFGWSVLSFGLYFIWYGLLVAGRYVGFFRGANKLLCRKRDAQHKRVRAAWKAQFASSSSSKAASGGGGGNTPVASPTSVAAASPSNVKARLVQA